MRLKDKVALITGASSGIGAGVAARFAAEGAYVALNFRPGSAPDREAAERAVAGFTTRAVAVEGDVSDRAQVEAMVDRVVRELGRLDVCVCNAGIEVRRDFLDTTDEEWHRVLGVNLFGAFAVSQAAARVMVRQGGGGRLLFMSSVHEDIPFPGYTSYCASKGAVRMLMRNLAMELAPHRITVNNIAPGAIATPINRAVLEDPVAYANAVSEIPLGRFGTPEDVAAVATFLASDEAGYVTGSTYYVDGGLTQQVTLY
ncbi:short-chain dehydrogenase/reductase SDR [Gemmatirosa kalamazoonensis]|uniref:Short-chain dehydrogenase/reductase SDR n=1 Tax=Gemmatirosa kalamazoonensis TaxID=861299 RepID=W0RJ88_9BACT|nr:glucose 1-dehydrogenase [Gemmatirosa kalamazoonensis]AHG89483.1 short-chain dehydrogenase/reductase SDR [Gemmatirosa kalamazoonensis]